MIQVSDFISNIWDGKYSPLDIKNILREVTNGFNKNDLRSVELSIYLFEEEKLEEFANNNRDVDYSNEFDNLSLGSWLNGDDSDLYKRRKEIYFNAYPNQYMRMYNFRKMIHNHIKSSHYSNFNQKIAPIHWLKGEDSLSLFIEELKSAGLIENRETEEIIQEHFRVEDKLPTKESKPIKWLINIKFLAYLIDRLGEEFIINIKGSKHKLTANHFVNSDGNDLNTSSLSSFLSQIKKHGRSTDKNISSIENIIQRIKS